MTPEQQRLIDIKMFVEYRARPVAWEGGEQWKDWSYGVYESQHQRFYVEFNPTNRAVTV